MSVLFQGNPMCLYVEIVKQLGITHTSVPNLKKEYQPNERAWKKEKHAQIQDDDEDCGSRNVNHIQHIVQS